jgi:hypothetical protein
MASFPLPRRRVNPALRETVRATRRPVWRLAYDAGFVHVSKFSALLNADDVPDSPANVQKLERIADVIGFPRERLFLDGDSRG